MESKIGVSKSQYSDLSTLDKVEGNYGDSNTSGPVEEVIISRKEKCVSCCKKFTAFLFSTIGLTSMLVGYTIFGAFIFTNLEAPYELREKSQIQNARKWHVQKLWNTTMEMNVFFEQNWTAAAEVLFLNYTDKVYEAVKKNGWDGNDRMADVQWSFAGAMLYSITVITTIGYGHIAPKTFWGRIVTILYAIVGIPLCLLTLTNLGGFMATAFRYIYNNICCGLCCLCCEKPKPKYTTKAVNDPNETSSVDGLASPTGDSIESRNGKSPTEKKKKVSMEVTWRSGVSRVLKTEDNKTLTVPIYVSLLLIAGYILSGAVLFSVWEDDWDYLEGSYFVFITLTTIGFGDYVPGSSVDSWNNQQKLVLCAMYLIFGLALIAMCFDLMQEEMRSKMRKLGKKFGLIAKESTTSTNNPEDSQKAVQVTSTAKKKPKKSQKEKTVKAKPDKSKKEKDKKPKSKEKKDKSSSQTRGFRLSKPLYSKAKSKEPENLIEETDSVQTSPDGTPLRVNPSYKSAETPYSYYKAEPEPDVPEEVQVTYYRSEPTNPDDSPRSTSPYYT